MKHNTGATRLVERAKRGDTSAFAELYSRYSKPVYFVALKMLGNEYDAKDVLQDVMFTLYQSLGTIRNPKGLSSFLNRTTYRVCIKRLQKDSLLASSEEEYDLALEQTQEESAEFIPEDYADRQETREMIEVLVESLPLQMKSVVLLYYYEEMPVREIARTLDTNVQTVKTRLHRARVALKDKLNERETKEGVLRAMAAPVLTTILRQQADFRYTPEIGGQVWESLGAQLGLPAAVVAASAAAATAPGAVSIAAGTTVGATAITTKLAALSLAAVATTGAVILGVNVSHVVQPTESIVEHAYTADEEIPLLNIPDILPGGAAGDDIDSPSQQPYRSHPNTDGEIFPPDNGSRATPSTSSAGATTPADASGFPTADDAGSTSGGGGRGSRSSDPGIRLQSQRLHYPLGSQLSAEQILSDSGAAFRLELEVARLDQVDTARSGEYAVYIQTATQDDQPAAYRRVVVVVIE